MIETGARWKASPHKTSCTTQQWWRLPQAKVLINYLKRLPNKENLNLLGNLGKKRQSQPRSQSWSSWLQNKKIPGTPSSGFGVASSFFITWYFLCCMLVRSSCITRYACCWVLKCNDNRNPWYDTDYRLLCFVEVYEWMLKCNNINNLRHDTDYRLSIICRGVRVGAKVQ